MDGCPRSESNKGPSLDSQSHMRSKRYSSLEFCIWHVLLYSVIIEVYIYVTVLASLNTSYNNNIIVKHFRGLVLGLPDGLTGGPRSPGLAGCHASRFCLPASLSEPAVADPRFIGPIDRHIVNNSHIF